MSPIDHLNKLDETRRSLKRHALHYFRSRWQSPGTKLQARHWLKRAIAARLELAKAEWQAEEDERKYDMPTWAHPAT